METVSPLRNSRPSGPNEPGASFAVLALTGRPCAALYGARRVRLAASALFGAIVSVGLSAGHAQTTGTFTETEGAALPTSNILAESTTGGGPQNNALDYTDNAGPPGQTFTLSGAASFAVTSFTIEGRGDAGGSSAVNWGLQLDSFNGTTLTPIANDTAMVTWTANNDYLTFTLPTAVILTAGQYEFTVFSTAGYYGLAHSTADAYAGGVAVNNAGGGRSFAAAGNAPVQHTWDLVFAVQGTVQTAGGLTWSGAVSSVWDIGTTANFTGSNYTDFNPVIFGDTDGNGQTVANTAITIATPVSPSTMTMNNVNAAYSFKGALTNTTFVQVTAGTTTLGGPLSAGAATDATNNAGLSAVVSAGTLILNKASSAGVSAVSQLSISNGATVLVEGTGSNQIASTATVSVNGLLDLHGNDVTFDGLASTGNTGIITDGSATAGLHSVTIGSNNSTATFGGVIKDGGASSILSLTKMGTGAETFTNTQAYTGATTINGGSLVLGVGGLNGTLAPGNNVTVNSGGSIVANAGDAFGYSTGAINLIVNEGGIVNVNGGNRATLANPITLTGARIASAGAGDGNGNYSLLGQVNATSAPDGTASLISATQISLQNNAGNVFNVTKGGGPVDLKISSTIADFPGTAGALTKTGNGVLNLAGTGTYSGGTTVSQGTLAFSSSSALGAGPITLTGGTLQSQGVQTAGALPVISIKFQGGQGGVTGPAVTGVEGVVPAGNWNNVTGQTGTAIALTDSNGISNAATLASFSSTNTWSTGSADPLLNGYIDHSTGNPGAQQVTVSGIPYANYEVIPYFGSDGANRGGSVNIGPTTYYYNTLGVTTNYVQTTDTDPTTEASTAPQADYAIFNGVTGSSFTIDEEVLGNNGLFGVQIVGTTAAAVTVANPVTVLANSAIDVTGPNAATFSGAFTIGANTLAVTGGSTGTNAPYTLTLGLGGVTLTGNATFSVANNGTGAGMLIAGVITDNGGGFGLTKTGNGSMVVQGPNSYVGATVVNEGALIVEGGISGTSSVNVTGTVSNGSGGFVAAFLGGSGTITASGNVTVGAHGGLYPGVFGTPSTLDLELGAGAVTLGAQSNSDFLLTPSDTTAGQGINDLLTVTGTLTLGGTVLPLAFGGGAFGAGTWELASVATGTLSGAWTLDPTFLAAYPGSSITKSGDEVLLNIVAIPEPGAGMALLTGLGLCTGLRRFRRKEAGRS